MHLFLNTNPLQRQTSSDGIEHIFLLLGIARCFENCDQLLQIRGVLKDLVDHFVHGAYEIILKLWNVPQNHECSDPACKGTFIARSDFGLRSFKRIAVEYEDFRRFVIEFGEHVDERVLHICKDSQVGGLDLKFDRVANPLGNEQIRGFKLLERPNCDALLGLDMINKFGFIEYKRRRSCLRVKLLLCNFQVHRSSFLIKRRLDYGGCCDPLRRPD